MFCHSETIIRHDVIPQCACRLSADGETRIPRDRLSSRLSTICSGFRLIWYNLNPFKTVHADPSPVMYDNARYYAI